MAATRQQNELDKGDDRDKTQDDEVKNSRNGTDKGLSENTQNGNGASKSTDSPKQEGLMARFNAWLDKFLFTQIDIAPLVYFRIIFGAIMFWEVTRFFSGNKIKRYYMDPIFYFKYFGFSWMPGPLPGYQMNLFYLAMGILYVFLILGLWYRVTTVLCFLGFFYWFNLDMCQHLNHFYLVSLVSFLMMFLPAHRGASLDVIRKPELRVATVPAWTRWLLVIQIGIAYFYGGIAKINWDWLQGEPMRVWLLNDYPQGHIFTTWWAPWFFSWGGLAYDLAVVPMLIWKRTRMLAVASTIFFHISNDNMFTIGIFPWFMLFSTPLYFEPELLHSVLKFEWIFAKPVTTQASLTDSPKRRPIVKRLWCLYVAWQCLMPFRHHLYPGYTGWTEEGHLYSWHMMLREKETDVDFFVKLEATGEKEHVDQRKFLTSRQQMRMAKRPEMILQFAHFLCKKYGEDDGGPVQVYAENMVSLNGRRKQHCVDPSVDLCKAKMTMRPATWILPLKIPLWDQSTRSLLRRINGRDGAHYVNTPAVKDFGGNLRFGTITAYVPNEKPKKGSKDKGVWNVKFDDGFEVTFDRRDLATSHRLYARHVHGAEVGEEAETSEL